MSKRKFTGSDDEDEQDQDYQDDEIADDDFVPSSNEGDEEHRSVPSLRATKSRSGHTTSNPQNRDNEETREQTDDDGADVTFEADTSAAPHQDATEIPKVSKGKSGRSKRKAPAGRVRKTGKTEVCGVFTIRKAEPKKVVRSEGKFYCINCGSNFTRAEGVNYHFPGCVQKYGNPGSHNWNDHESCASRRTRRAGTPQQPIRKQIRVKKLPSRLSSANPSGNNLTPRTKPMAHVEVLPTEKRVTRSKLAQRAPEAQENSGTSKSQPKSGTSTTKTSSKQKASNPPIIRPKPAEIEPQKKANRPRPQEKPKQISGSKQAASGAGKQTKLQLAENLPPLSDMTAIFFDMVSIAWDTIGLKDALECLSEKQINIATMCSGTESPLLALAEIQKGLRRSGKPAMNIQHMFSAEIVPYKQAYIERNFHPDKLFRDIREIAAGGKATTAYGALTDVPPEVDVLVAGFSCVDFSKLNKNAKELTDIGESGDTFRAILQYAKKYRPAMIILENVEGAPWDLIKAIWESDKEFIQAWVESVGGGEDTGLETFWDTEDVAYSAMWQRVDAKNYYIPQTRTRRYMICLDRCRFSSRELADCKVEEWKRNMVALERKASAPVEAFLLPEDDPRLQYAKDEMSKTGNIRRETDWEVCMGRHENYRTQMQLGTSRPILEWTNDGCAKASSYIWTDWILSQVERIWDTIEISYLRNVLGDRDSWFKSRFWELSQNIDRFLDKTPEGIIGCLTPKGQQFSTIRGRPITGLEAIALQGLPIDVLLLTRESQRELIDLGGNAMTSTAVGAALLSGLAVSHSILTRAKEPMSQPLHNTSPILERMRFSELRQKQVLIFDGAGELSLDELCKMAKASVCLCRCEGQSLTTSALIRKCKRCSHHCCEKCGNMPKHDFELLEGNGAPLRTEPNQFRKQVEYSLPTRLEIDGFSAESLEAFAQFIPGRSEQDWKIFSEATLLAFKEEYRYQSVMRSHRWTITYNAVHSQLKLVFDEEEVYWLLYGKAGESEAVNSPVRALLDQPLARLTVRGRKLRGGITMAQNVIEGSWEICLPMKHTFPIFVAPQGEMTDSWEKKLGLQGEKFVDKQVFTSLQISRPSDLAAELILDHEIWGDYDLLDNCGTACSSLHRKRPTVECHDEPSLFLFLHVDRDGPPEQDSFVFSTDIHRLEYGESRYVAAIVDNKWRPPYKNSDESADLVVPSEVSCRIFSRWEPCSIFLRPYRGLEEASVRFSKNEISMPIFGAHDVSSNSSVDDVYGCLHEAATTALLSCVLPGQLADNVAWQVGHWTVMDQKSERQIAAMFAWLFAQVKDLGGFERDWRSLGPHPQGYHKCQICAPEPPKILWTCSRGGKLDKIIPYEDGREAGNFERKIKARPAPFLVQTCIDDDEKHTGQLLVGLHLPTLVHRALARLGNIADNDDIDMKWRLDTQWEAPTRYRLREFTLTNNKLSLEAKYDFPTGESLRPEQKRSLHWMVRQEADDMAFYEEETEEAILSQLNWRAEVRVRRARIIRGGVLADEVGYGKTATTLALTDMQKRGAEDYAGYQNSGCLPVKATLILVPLHLIHQWKGQIRKFLGLRSDDERILVIEKMIDLTAISVKRIKNAVIVLVAWQVLNTTTYMARMSHFATLPMGPSSGGREIEAWLTRACGNVEKHMGELITKHKSPNKFAKVLKQRLKSAHNDETILRDIPTQRLKGAKYKTWNPAERVTPKDPTPKEADLENFFKHMTDSKCKDVDSMTGILLHMFDFYRIVVDEYTYVDDEKISNFITTINARSRWVLSGTPRIQDFGDVHNLARFLACSLGIVDDAAGVLKGATIRHIRDRRTAAEQFRAFGFSHTAAWHMSRQAYAQEFLDKYASKNVPEIGLIKSLLHLCPHSLGAAETIPNAELQQQLQSTDMKIVLQGKNKKENDRFRRYKELLQGCKTASECLIKSCSYFEQVHIPLAQDEPLGDAMDIDDDDLPAKIVSGSCRSLITIREKEMTALITELEHNLLHAAWLEEQCRRATKAEHRGSHYLRWKSDIESVGLKDPAATSALRDCLIAAREKLGAKTEAIFYRNPPTKEQLRDEKIAADERKKREKAKKAADKKPKKVSEGYKRRKISGKSRATASADGDNDSSGEPIPADDMNPSPSDPKPNKIRKDDFETFASELRSLTANLRSLVSEFISRTRSLRFACGAQKLQQWYADQEKPPTCMSCGKSAGDYNDISINIRCGHLTCKQCLQKTASAVCAVSGCDEGSESFRLRRAVDLVGDGETWEYGSRMGNIIALINSLPADEQVLLFVQFEDVMLNMARGLEAAGISNHALCKGASQKMVEMLNDFQDNDGELKKKVLLLNPLSETASGINLTNANHVIFASPLLTRTQQSYDALMTQCIGRAKRYGQRNTVHIYRFFALRTIDVDVLQEREQRTVVKKEAEAPKNKKSRKAVMGGPGRGEAEGEWLLVSQDLIDDTMEAGWGSGYDFKSNPAEEDD